MKRFSWLPRLSRRARIVRNFLLAAVLGAAVVLALGTPPLTKYGVFRRLEEEYLLKATSMGLAGVLIYTAHRRIPSSWEAFCANFPILFLSNTDPLGDRKSVV